MKMAAHPALARGKVDYVGDAGRRGDRRERWRRRKDAAEKVVVDYEVLPAVVDPAQGAEPSAPQIHDDAPNNTIYQWHLGDTEATDAAFAGGQARHQDRHRQQPAGAQRDGAARGDRRVRWRHRALHALEHDRRIRMWRGW